MLDGLRQFIADVVSPEAPPSRAFDDNDYRLAATALLIHVISLDGEPTTAEKQKLHGLIESSFGLDRGTADRWRHPGTQRVRQGRCHDRGAWRRVSGGSLVLQ